MKAWRTSAICVALLLNVAGGAKGDDPTVDDPTVTDIVSASLSDRSSLLSRVDPSKRVDVYVEVMPRLHPPDLGLAEVVAKTGEAAIPRLKHFLVSGDDRTVVDLSMIMSRMQRSGWYDVKNDAELYRLYKNRILSARIPSVVPVLKQSAGFIGWNDLTK